MHADLTTAEDRSATGRKRVFHLLDAIRGIAAIIVFKWHLKYLFNEPQWNGGFLAVDLFFVLSGFVIAHAYEDKLLQKEPVPWSNFMLRRLIRLYPLYLIGIVAAVLKLSAHFITSNGGGPGPTTLLAGIFSALLMLPHWGVPSLFTARWSLTYELFINAISARFVSYLGTITLLSIVTLSGILLIVSVIWDGSINSGWYFNQTLVGLGRVFYSFFIGVLVYRAHMRKLANVYQAGLIVIVFLLSAGAASVFPAETVIEFLLIFIGFPLLTFLAAIPEVTGPATQVCGFLGVTSYALYVLHESVGGLFAAVIQHFWKDPSLVLPSSGYALLLALLIACWLLDRFYDQPVRQALARRFLKRPVPQGGTAQLT